MEDEITKRELSDDELDNVSGGGCEENARNCCPQCGSTEAKTIFSREDGSLVECAVQWIRGTGKFKAHSKVPARSLLVENPAVRIDDNGLRDFYKKILNIALYNRYNYFKYVNIGNTQN